VPAVYATRLVPYLVASTVSRRPILPVTFGHVLEVENQGVYYLLNGMMSVVPATSAKALAKIAQ
jgi:hypothetical protein